MKNFLLKPVLAVFAKNSKKSLSANIASLSVLQAINFAVTLSILPYLARALGVEGWGHVTFVLLIINYMLWVSNWSFYLGATKKIAASRTDKLKLSYIFVNTLVAQWALTVILLLALVVILLLAPISKTNQLMYIAGAGLLIGNAITPLWFLNGLELIKEAAFIQLCVKVFTIPPIFLFVHTESDTVTYIAINSVSSVVVGCFVIWRIYKNNVIQWGMFSFKNSLHEVLHEYHLFLGAFWANARTQLIPTVLGIVGGASELGFYNLAERARSAAIIILHPISQALFPRMCYLFGNDTSNAKQLLKQSGTVLFILSGLLSLVLFVFAKEVIDILGGETFNNAVSVLQWMALTPLLSTVSTFIVHQIIIPIGDSHFYNRFMLVALLINLVLIVPIAYFEGANGAAFVLLCSELFMVFYALKELRKKGLLS